MAHTQTARRCSVRYGCVEGRLDDPVVAPASRRALGGSHIRASSPRGRQGTIPLTAPRRGTGSRRPSTQCGARLLCEIDAPLLWYLSDTCSMPKACPNDEIVRLRLACTWRRQIRRSNAPPEKQLCVLYQECERSCQGTLIVDVSNIGLER